MDSSKDLILLVGLGVLVLVGVFATELAGESWDLVQEEIKLDEAKRRERGELEDDDKANAEPLQLGPVNSDQLRNFTVGLVPTPVKDEVKEVWETLNAFAEYQWAPAAKQAIDGRRRRADDEQAVPGADSENPLMRLLASLATPAEQGEAEGEGPGVAGLAAPAASSHPGGEAEPPSAATMIYGEDAATPEDLAERRARADWSLDGGLGRTVLTSLLFTFALADASRRKWSEYPESDEERELLLGPDTLVAAADSAEP